MTEDEKKELNSILNRLNDLHSELMDSRADIEALESRFEIEISKLEDCISDRE